MNLMRFQYSYREIILYCINRFLNLLKFGSRTHTFATMRLSGEFSSIIETIKFPIVILRLRTYKRIGNNMVTQLT